MSSLMSNLNEPQRNFDNTSIEHLAISGNEQEQATLIEPDGSSWLKRHWKAVIGAGFFAVSLGVSATQFNKVEESITQDAPIVVPTLIATEALAWSGAAMIFASAGNKIGNPLTLKSRLSEVKDELEHNRTYKYGLAVNILGAAGTSVVVGVSAIASAPARSWPLAFSVSAASLGFSGLPWVWANKREPENLGDTRVLEDGE